MDAYRFSIAWSRIFPSKSSLKFAFMLYLAPMHQANKAFDQQLQCLNQNNLGMWMV